VVGARLPERVPALHPAIADEDVLQSEGERMTHMQAAGHIGRRHHDRIGLGIRPRMRGESARILPERVKFRLDLGGSVSLVQHR